LALLCFSGCAGNPTQPSGPSGDNSGEHLVVFATDRARAAGDYALGLYDLDNAGFRSLANLDAAGVESEPCLSNDGGFIAFAATRGSGATLSDIYLYDRLTQALIPTPGLNTTGAESWPRFTYDSVQLAFVTQLVSGEKRVRLYDPIGNALVPLPGLDAPPTFDDDMPAPNLDGTRIAFSTNRTGNADVRVWDRSSGLAVKPLLASAGLDTDPSLSSNGRWLAFTSDRAGGAGGADVYLYDLTADSLVALAGLNSAGDERHPSVNANGSVLLFQSNRTSGGGQYDLYRYTLPGGITDQPAAFRNISDDIQPYLRYR
jgi:Tol biopolymer transport system component